MQRFERCSRQFGSTKQLEEELQRMSEFAFKQGQKIHSQLTTTVRTAKYNDYNEMCDVCGERSSSHVTIGITSTSLHNGVQCVVCTKCIDTLYTAEPHLRARDGV